VVVSRLVPQESAARAWPPSSRDTLEKGPAPRDLVLTGRTVVFDYVETLYNSGKSYESDTDRALVANRCADEPPGLDWPFAFHVDDPERLG
jgi:hypothetical protein